MHSGLQCVNTQPSRWHSPNETECRHAAGFEKARVTVVAGDMEG